MKSFNYSRLALYALVATLSSAHVWSYTPPLGIPAPPFGIDESHNSYTGQTFSAGGFVYKDAGNGPYSHYVDNTYTACTDSGNTYGSKEKPRCSVPTSVPAGSVVELHGGPYGKLLLDGVNGTASKPIYFRGYSNDNKVTFNAAGAITIRNSSYIIIENLVTDGSGLSNVNGSVGLNISQPTHHVSIRHSEGKNYPMPDYCPAKEVGCWFSSAWNLSGDQHWSNGQEISDIVLYANRIHHNGDYFPTYESGRHAITIAGATNRVWVLENELTYNAEDGLQIFWFADGSHGPPAKHIYIGKNDIGNNGENALDIKQAFDVILSQNKVYGYKNTRFPKSGSDGSAIVLNDDSPNDRLWVIHNEIYDSEKGIRSQTTGNAYIIGNLIYNIHRGAGDPAPTSPGNSFGVAIATSAAKSIHIVHNTFNDVDGGVYAAYGAEIYVHNNIMANLARTDGYHMAIADTNFATLYTANNLLFSKNGNNATRGVSDCEACIIGSDPLFLNESANNFRVYDNSPAENAGSPSEVYDIFQQLYGINIGKDFSLAARNIKTQVDIGAYIPGIAEPSRPLPPSSLTVTVNKSNQ